MSHELLGLYVLGFNSKRVVHFALIFMMVSIPFSASVINHADAQSAVVCCDDAHAVDLYLIGGSTGELTPFSQLLGDEALSHISAQPDSKLAQLRIGGARHEGRDVIIIVLELQVAKQ